jgi:hypothetical protein
MAAGPDSHTVDEEGEQEHPGHGEPVGGFEHDHDHGHDDHGHDDHGSGGDAWVLIPIVIGLVIGLALALWFGLGSGASPLG